jgi:hypothetical protein
VVIAGGMLTATLTLLIVVRPGSLVAPDDPAEGITLNPAPAATAP